MNLARASVKIFLAKVITSLASFVAVVVFSRGLGADPLGIYYPFVALLGILSLPTDFGLSIAIEKRISEREQRSRYFGAGLFLRFLLLTSFSIPIYLIQDHIVSYIGANIGGILLIALWIQAGADFSIAVLKGELRVGETALIRVLQPLIWLVVGYVLLSIGYGVEGIIYSHIFGTVAIFITATWRISIWPSIPEWKHLRSLFDFSKFSFVNSIGGLVYSWMDVLVLTAFVSLEIVSTRGQVGAYENAWRVSLLVTFVSRSISQVVFPQISQWNTQNEVEKIERVLSKAIIPGIIIVPPSLAGVIIFSEEILIYLFGDEFVVAAPALVLLVGLRFFEVLDSIYGRMLDAFDRPDLTMISTVASISTNLVLNILLIYKFGILGAAIATTIAVIIKTYLDIYYLEEYIMTQIPYKILLWSILSSVIMGLFLYLFSTSINVTSLTELLMSVAVGTSIYMILVLLYTPIRDNIIDVF